MSLTIQQLKQFEKNGYLVAENALNASDLDPVIHEYEAYIDKRAQLLLAQGKLSDSYQGQSFEHRLASICRENKEIYPELDIMVLRGKASFEFLANKRLLDIVEQFIGPEIVCSPIQHLRPKLPTNLAISASAPDTHIAPWHQDAGVTWAEADPFFILTVWVPLTEANEENGCMQIIPRQQGKGLKQHATHPVTGTAIVAEDMPATEPLSLPMKKGDVLFMHKEIPHRSLPNRSNGVRWSMDLRYQKTGTPTGRPFHPEFIVRSRANPDSVQDSYSEWDRRWAQALKESANVQQHRWQVAETA